MMGEKIKVGTSACLLGENVRYDGGHKLDRFLTETLARYVEYVPVCPEVECGLPTPRKSMGYFRGQLSADEKQELIEIIELYRNGNIPLVVPITLMRHYVRKYDQPYLKEQVYLNPHPIELQLRNHV
jgi:uncharacterized protein YbgA (DUF1722 family)